jgi:hypothetical protein
MHLRPGGLKHVTSAKANSKQAEQEASEGKTLAPRTMPNWCQYPPPKLKGGGRLVYDQKDADSLFTSLPLLRQLLPLPFEQLLPAGALELKGEMSLQQREEHTKSEETKWLSTGELDLMLSILLCDGRYEDATYILPTSDGQALRLGFEALKTLKPMLQLTADNESVLDKANLEKLIKDTLRIDSTTIKKNQQMTQNYVLEHIIDRNPGLLSKKVLVFPQNEWEEHWSVTFVFNAGSIRAEFEAQDESKPSLQPCFFRYCSSIPDGSRVVDLDSGVLWFLNLCYSNEILEQNLPNAKAAPMKWLSPYRKRFQYFGAVCFDGNHKAWPHDCIGFNDMILLFPKPFRQQNGFSRCAFGCTLNQKTVFVSSLRSIRCLQHNNGGKTTQKDIKFRALLIRLKLNCHPVVNCTSGLETRMTAECVFVPNVFGAKTNRVAKALTNEYK